MHRHRGHEADEKEEQQREEAQRALEELEDPEDEEDEQPRGFFRSRRRRRKKKKSKKNTPVEMAELASKVKEDAENEEEEAQQYRSILSSMFGINHDKEQRPSDEAPDYVKAEEPDGESQSDETTETANKDANDDLDHSIDEPAEIVEPQWAREVEPSTPEIDRSEVRGADIEESDQDSERREKSRELARRLAMTSLRDVANQSARNALTEHTQRRLSRKMWVDGGLSIVALGLGGTYLLNDFSSTVSWSTYGWVAIVIGAIALIEMFRTFVRWQRATSWKRDQATRKSRRKTAEDRYDKFLNQGRAYGGNPWSSQHKH